MSNSFQTGSGPSGSDSNKVLEDWLVAPEALGATIRAGSRDFLQGLEGLSAAYAIIRAEALGVAVLDRNGRILAATPNFAEDIGQTPGKGRLDLAVPGRGASIQLVNPSREGVRTGLAVGPLDMAAGWALPPDILAATRAPGAAAIALSATPGSVGVGLEQACRAFQLTPAQTRIVRGLLLTGNVRSAARILGIAYDTAREAIGEAMQKVGVNKLAALTDRLTRLSFGAWPVGPHGEAVLMDTWGLSPRQATLALRIVEGMTRDEAAGALGISAATIKNELRVIFQILDVQSSSGLARAITEAQILSLLTDATRGAIVIRGEGPDPLAMASRADGSVVAYSDYGPGSGAPLFVLHSSLTCRSIPRPLVHALQDAGFRPIAVDRAGFGLTEPPASPDAWREAPFSVAVDDMEIVATELNIGRLDLLCRGAAHVAVAAQMKIPERLARVVLLSPDPPTDVHGRYRGLAGAMAEAFHRHPAAIGQVLNAFAHWFGKGLGRRILNNIIGDSLVDQKTMAVPGNFADFERSIRPFITGRTAGVIAEQTALTRWSSAAVPGVAHWQVINGEEDRMTSPEAGQAFWQGVLPGAGFHIIADAGRFLPFSHPDLIARAVRDAPRPARGVAAV